MAGVVRVIIKLFTPQARIVETNGQPSVEFYQYMLRLDAKVRELEARIAALEP